MLSLHDIHVFDKIKIKFQELDCEWIGQMEEYTIKSWAINFLSGLLLFFPL